MTEVDLEANKAQLMCIHGYNGVPWLRSMIRMFVFVFCLTMLVLEDIGYLRAAVPVVHVALHYFEISKKQLVSFNVHACDACLALNKSKTSSVHWA